MLTHASDHGGAPGGVHPDHGPATIRQVGGYRAGVARVVIVGVGTLGDVAPYTGLARALAAAGHEPVIATHEPFRGLVEACGARFRALPIDMRAELGSERGQRSLRTSALGPARMTMLLARHWREVGRAVAAAADGADLLLLSALGFAGYHVAEALGIPSAGAFLQPLEPTGEFAPSALTTRSLGRRGNRASAWALMATGQVPFARATGELRAELGLAPLGPVAMVRRMHRENWPVLYGFSPTVVPLPRDWPPGRVVTGYWWPFVTPGWTPPAELTAFLDAGAPPVFIGFGSMTPDRPDLGRVVTEAVRAAGVRAVVQAGWAELAGTGDDVLAIGEVPHEWLFPRTAAVVHHAGGGTTAAVLRAGVPGVGLPVAVDQPFWADRAARLGTGPPPVPLARIDAAGLAAAITAATTVSAYRREAERIAARIRAEDGGAAAVAAVEQVVAGQAPQRAR
jgi:UDP:flavonoid glycosyltransferase YjiC (YdhE family)